MIKKKLIGLFIVLFFGFAGYGQFFKEDFSAEPDVDTLVNYEKGIILFKISLVNDYHITDLKHNFFRVEVQENEYLQITKVEFPKGVPYADEMVFKGDIDVPVYVKPLKEITEPVTLKFKVSYQVCQEKPREVCFPPSSQDIDVKVIQAFKRKEVKIAKKSDTLIPLEDLSPKTSPTAYKPKGGNWLILLLAALFLLGISVFIGLSKAIAGDGIAANFSKAIVVLLLLTGAFLFLKSLDIKYFPTRYSQKPKKTVELKWIQTIDEGKEIAKKENKKIMIDTYADWCLACKELDEYTFSDPEVAKALKDYVMVKLDFTKMSTEDRKLQRELNVIGMPTVIFLDSEGEEERRFSGFKNKKEFLTFIGEGSGLLDKLLNLLKKELEQKSLLLFALVFVLGFLTSLTPCVYPVIPIIMGYIGTRSSEKKLKGFYLSIFFVLGLAVVYSILGVAAAATGSMVGVSFQEPIVVIIIAAIFIVMGLSLAGLFEIPVPSSISSKIQSGGGKSEIIGAILMGGIAGIIAAPCVGPVLIVILSWISVSGNIFLGFWLTFIFSLGMGIIFLLVGTFSGVISTMPKGGQWMSYVKYFFSVILIGGGIYILTFIAPEWLNFLLWGIFLVAISLFIGLFKAHEEYKFRSKLYKFIVLVIFLFGIFLFFKSLELKYFTVSSSHPTPKPAPTEDKISQVVPPPTINGEIINNQ
jgi:thiol:disulfide interchange protein